MKTKFGETLRALRQASNDPDRLNRRLTQERLGELIGHELGDRGFTGAAVSDWERGESKLGAEDRNVLLALIKVLRMCGGLKASAEADRFLESGNYRALAEDEARIIFPGERSHGQVRSASKNRPGSSFSFLTGNLFGISEDDYEILISNAKEEGPDPWWPRALAALMRATIDRISIQRAAVSWMWVGVAAWWLMAPSLRLPFADRNEMFLAVEKYVIGSLVIPLAIGLLVNTKNNEYWKQQAGANSLLLRVYTYQGAGIGFNLGYFFIFPVALFMHYLNIGPSAWVGLAAVVAGLVLGNMGARVVPHNLWKAYGRLKLSDGAIFFAAAFVGPLWGFFILEFSYIVLAPVTGLPVILAAISILVIAATRQSFKRG